MKLLYYPTFYLGCNNNQIDSRIVVNLNGFVSRSEYNSYIYLSNDDYNYLNNLILPNKPQSFSFNIDKYIPDFLSLFSSLNYEIALDGNKYARLDILSRETSNTDFFVFRQNTASSFYFSYLSTSNIFVISLESEDEFETDLYPELLDNEETKLQLQNWIDDNNPYWEQYTDKDIKAMELIEKYNKNVLLLRSTRKVDASVSGSISQSGQQTDLTGVESKLQNINNNLTNLNSKLEIEKTIDNETETKSITQIIDEKSSDSPIVVSSEDLSPWSAV